MLLDTVVYTIANGNFLGAFLSFMISAPRPKPSKRQAVAVAWQRGFHQPRLKYEKNQKPAGHRKKKRSGKWLHGLQGINQAAAFTSIQSIQVSTYKILYVEEAARKKKQILPIK